MTDAIVPGKVVELSPLVRRITQNNPGIMTGPGTNTYIVGNKSLFVIDPGEDTDDHLSAILKHIGKRRVAGIAPTHAHPDHWPLAPRIALALGTLTLGFSSHNGYVPMRLVAEGEVLRGEDWSLKALHTPGHVSDHVSYFLQEEKALFSGDNVMAWSTSVIARPDGSLNSYLASLERLRGLDIAVIYPAHGLPVPDAHGRIGELIEHRKMRTAEILLALRERVESVSAIVRRIYVDVDPRLHPAAQQSVLSHLDALLESGLVKIKHIGTSESETSYSLAS